MAHRSLISLKKGPSILLAETYFHLVFFLSTLVLISCQKEQPAIILDQDYLQVADILHYCQGSCDEIQDWENSETLVTGHIIGIENDSTKNEYLSKGTFYLLDIRNGMYLEVRITEYKEQIFEKIWNAKKTAVFQIKGMLNAVYAFDNDSCIKGVNILLDHPDNINYH
jgi:hypothetical protein